MSGQVFEQHIDEYGNVFVRVSQDIVVLTREDADLVKASFDRLNAENERLREQIHWLKQGDILHVLTDQEYIDLCERERLMQVSIDALDKDNAKLRELLARVERARRDLCDAYPDAELLNCEECPAWSECKGDLADHTRELGVTDG